MKHFVYFIAVGLIAAAGLAHLQASTPSEDQRFAERVHLALRQVGHHLLQVAGDSKSGIPPIERLDPNRFRLNMGQGFDYDTLPQLLHQALLSYDIDLAYRVVIESCEEEIPMLGYNREAVESGDVACRGRDQLSECNNIVVTFDEPQAVGSQSKSWLLLLLVFGIGAILASIFWKMRNKKHIEGAELAVIESISTSIVPIGGFLFDFQNQELKYGDDKKDLTFRESKLLHYLAQHKNVVQPREVIIDHVWSDEGVIVGRSLDVFISRLRKLLKADENVAIKNIHGVGYRLELKV